MNWNRFWQTSLLSDAGEKKKQKMQKEKRHINISKMKRTKIQIKFVSISIKLKPNEGKKTKFISWQNDEEAQWTTGGVYNGADINNQQTDGPDKRLMKRPSSYLLHLSLSILFYILLLYCQNKNEIKCIGDMF